MLPVRNPQELVSIDFDRTPARAGSWSSRSANFTYAHSEQIRTRQQAFTEVLAWSAARFNLASGGEPRFAEGLYVSGDFFRTLGVGAMRSTMPTEYRADLAQRFLHNKLVAAEAGTGVSGLRTEYERPVFAESLPLAVAGAALGAGLAVFLTRALIAFISTPDNPAFIDVAPDWRVLAFTAALALLTCLLFGLLPALRGTHLSPVSAMRSGSRSVTAGRERFSILRALVATQVALSLVLLVGALLFVRGLHNLLWSTPASFPRVSSLFSPLHKRKARSRWPPSSYGQPDRWDR